ncbi:MAG: aminoacyl-tRNA hydrolase [Verrucomicrobiota bacterium]
MENLFLVAGLGNPGKKYAKTRHNAGFLLVERLAQDFGANWTLEKKFSSRLAKVDRGAGKFVLCQPQTFMNASGGAVKSLADYFQLPSERVLVVVDDADLPFGEIRLRGSGSSGGHHGLESVEKHLDTREFPRLRIGIGRKDGIRQITDFVLGQFGKNETSLLENVLVRAAEQVECWAAAGIGKAMSQFNGMVNIKEKRTE